MKELSREKIQAQLEDARNRVFWAREELEDAQGEVEELEDLLTALDETAGLELSTCTPFRPGQIAALREMGLEAIADQQERIAGKYKCWLRTTTD